jgi:hypothetical protein
VPAHATSGATTDRKIGISHVLKENLEEEEKWEEEK